MPTASTLIDLLRAGARDVPDRELVRFEGTSATYREIDEASNRLARELRRYGIVKGDRVAIMMPNGLDWPIAMLAVAKTSAITVPVNVTYGSRDLGHVLLDSGAKLALAGPAQVQALAGVQAECPELVDIVTEIGGAGLEPEPEGESIEPDDPVTIQYTSGTTGFPKGCVLTHRYWLAVGAMARDYASLGPEDVLLTAQPFYYMDPTWNLVAAMWAGAPLVILPKFSASTFWQSVKENEVSFFYCLGTMPVYLFKQPERPDPERAHRVRIVMCSGIPAGMHRAFEDRWACPWRETYGSTELGGVLAVPTDDDSSVGSGAMGQELEGYEARVADPEGCVVPDGETGEFQVRGGITMAGYWSNPEATREWKPDSWARTGDLVFRDERGYYHIVGRLKDMIRRGGENIAAAEVEAALTEHPAVRAAACIAVPDDERGEEVKAFVQLQEDLMVDGLSPEELLEFAAQRLAPFKLPRYVEYVDAFSLTPSERIEKQKLREAKPDQRAGAYDAITRTWN